MAGVLKPYGILSLVLTILLAVGYAYTSWEWLLTLAITFGTIAYHLIMRLLVSLVFNSVMKNQADIRKRRYQAGRLEMAMYKRIKVQKWKDKMPSYDSTLFDPGQHSWNQIAQAMCQSEVIHETIVLLSFLPIFAGIWFGAYPVFIITSILSAAFDSMFVMMQRYNRQRIIKLLSRKSGIK